MEYTIKFSDLERVARHYGYKRQRGSYADIFNFHLTPELRYILTSSSIEPDHERVRHFIHDLYKYECLFLSRE